VGRVGGLEQRRHLALGLDVGRQAGPRRARLLLPGGRLVRQFGGGLVRAIEERIGRAAGARRGAALGVAALIVVTSVMNGFNSEIVSKLLGLNGHFSAYP